VETNTTYNIDYEAALNCARNGLINSITDEQTQTDRQTDTHRSTRTYTSHTKQYNTQRRSQPVNKHYGFFTVHV